MNFFLVGGKERKLIVMIYETTNWKICQMIQKKNIVVLAFVVFIICLWLKSWEKERERETEREIERECVKKE